MVRSIVLAALAARAAAMSWSLPAALVDDDAHAVFGDGLTIHVHLEADERAALIYVDGALALELPDKRWALLSEPPCEEGTAPRWTSGVLPIERNGAVEVAVHALRCDGGGVFGGAATVAVVVDDEDCDEDVTVVDAFTYWDERDHVATRRRELAGLADVHVAVEGDRSFRGAPKASPPLESFGNVVVHATALKPPAPGEDEPDYFDREAAQRDGIADALEALGDALGLDGDDLVLVGDVDEVPSARAVAALRRVAACDKRRARRGEPRLLGTPATLAMTHHQYAVDWAMPQAWSPFYACRVRDLVGEAARFSPNEGRFVSLQSAEDFESVGSASWLFAGADKSRFRNQSVQTEFRSLLRDGGWHLSYFPRDAGGAPDEAARLDGVLAGLRAKLTTFSHSHWGDFILGGGACASDAQLREDATLGRTLHEVEFRCRDRAKKKGNVGVSWASLDRWHLAYAGTSRVPAGLGPFHRAAPPKRAHVEIHLDGFVQAYWLEAAAFHDEASGRFDDFAYREAARRAASLVCCSFGQPPLGAGPTSHLQPDFNARVCDGFDARLSAVLRELDTSNRFVQRSAESTSM